MPSTKKSTVPNLQRGMAILELLAGSQRSATIAELSERLGYPSASVFRITQELTDLGYLARDPASKRFTLTTITARRELNEHLNQIVVDGYAPDKAEGMEGIHCLAAAIRDRNGYPVGALTISAPVSRLAVEDFASIGAIVSQAAREAEAIYCQ